MDEKEAEARPLMGTIFLVLQSMFSRTVASLSKQKHCHNSATRYFDDETSGAFYS